jgi:hypothetical protein
MDVILLLLVGGLLLHGTAAMLGAIGDYGVKHGASYFDESFKKPTNDETDTQDGN